MNNIDDYKSFLLKKGKSENTIYAYVTDVNIYLRFLKRENIDLYTSDKLTLMHYFQNLINLGKSEKSVTRVVISLRSFYTYLKEKELVKDVPKMEFKGSSDEKLPQILTVEEVDKIIRIVDKSDSKGMRDNALLELMYATGMKVTELIELNVEDINLDLNYVKCKDSKKLERIIPIGRSASKALAEYLKVRTKIAESGVSNLFVNLNGNKLTRQGIWRIVKEYAYKAEIEKDVCLNTFRHSFAVHLLQNGANVRAVQKLLGNQVLTYMDTYYEIMNNTRVDDVYMHTHPRA